LGDNATINGIVYIALKILALLLLSTVIGRPRFLEWNASYLVYRPRAKCYPRYQSAWHSKNSNTAIE